MYEQVRYYCGASETFSNGDKRFVTFVYDPGWVQGWVVYESHESHEPGDVLQILSRWDALRQPGCPASPVCVESSTTATRAR